MIATTRRGVVGLVCLGALALGAVIAAAGGVGTSRAGSLETMPPLPGTSAGTTVQPADAPTTTPVPGPTTTPVPERTPETVPEPTTPARSSLLVDPDPERTDAVDRAVVYRPPGGPVRAPVVVFLPGSDGMRRRYLDWARELSREGFVVVTGCWFNLPEPNVAVKDALPCPGAPRFRGVGPWAVDEVASWIEQVATDPVVGAYVDRSRIVISGFSRGASVALLAAGTEGFPAAAAVAIAPLTCGSLRQFVVPGEVFPVSVASTTSIPVLMMKAEDDDTIPSWHFGCEQRALDEAGVPLQVHTYPEGRHYVLFGRHRADVIDRTAAFVRDLPAPFPLSPPGAGALRG